MQQGAEVAGWFRATLGANTASLLPHRIGPSNHWAPGLRAGREIDPTSPWRTCRRTCAWEPPLGPSSGNTLCHSLGMHRGGVLPRQAEVSHFCRALSTLQRACVAMPISSPMGDVEEQCRVGTAAVGARPPQSAAKHPCFLLIDLEKLFHLSKPWFPHLQNGIITMPCL